MFRNLSPKNKKRIMFFFAILMVVAPTLACDGPKCAGYASAYDCGYSELESVPGDGIGLGKFLNGGKR